MRRDGYATFTLLPSKKPLKSVSLSRPADDNVPPLAGRHFLPFVAAKILRLISIRHPLMLLPVERVDSGGGGNLLEASGHILGHSARLMKIFSIDGAYRMCGILHA